ncbi:MAG: VOC family protein [Phycisphaerae bacterium]
MPAPVKPIPDGYLGASPYLICRGAAAAIDFYRRAFGAVERLRVGAGEQVGHAEVQIGQAVIMLADEFPQMGAVGPQTLGGTPVRIHVYVPDVDALARQAIAAGARVLRPLADQFYGDRTVLLEDPFGHVWGFATHIEDVSPDEINRRAAAKFSNN